jgi:hypothetical protein
MLVCRRHVHLSFCVLALALALPVIRDCDAGADISFRLGFLDDGNSLPRPDLDTAREYTLRSSMTCGYGRG